MALTNKKIPCYVTPPISRLIFPTSKKALFRTHEVLKSSIVWDTTPCSLLTVKKRFGGICRHHLHCIFRVTYILISMTWDITAYNYIQGFQNLQHLWKLITSSYESVSLKNMIIFTMYLMFGVNKSNLSHNISRIKDTDFCFSATEICYNRKTLKACSTERITPWIPGHLTSMDWHPMICNFKHDLASVINTMLEWTEQN